MAYPHFGLEGVAKLTYVAWLVEQITPLDWKQGSAPSFSAVIRNVEREPTTSVRWLRLVKLRARMITPRGVIEPPHERSSANERGRAVGLQIEGGGETFGRGAGFMAPQVP